MFGAFASEESAEAKHFMEAVQASGFKSVAHTLVPSIAARHGLAVPSVTLFKLVRVGFAAAALSATLQGSKRDTYAGDWTAASVGQFIELGVEPLVFNYTAHAHTVHTHRVKRHVLLFATQARPPALHCAAKHTQTDPSFAAAYSEFEDAARQFRGEELFVFVDASKEMRSARCRPVSCSRAAQRAGVL